MKTSTPETNNLTPSGNCLKPLLAVALFFRIRKFNNYDKSVFGFQNRFFQLGKNTKRNRYFYIFFDFTTMSWRQLHKGIKLPITGLQITIWCIIFNIFYMPFRLITFIPFMYLDGAKNFITNGWYNNVKFFNWINFLVLIFLLARLFLKSYC